MNLDLLFFSKDIMSIFGPAANLKIKLNSIQWKKIEENLFENLIKFKYLCINTRYYYLYVCEQ